MSGNTLKQNLSPFDLSNHQAYEDWRNAKLDKYPTQVDQLIVKIKDPFNLTVAEHKTIVDIYNKTNMVVYISECGDNPDKKLASSLANQFGLHHLDNNMGADDDAITSLQVSAVEGRERYIPYSNKAIHWHTDGYYNKLDKQIYALNLHCVRPAKFGGENALMDHEIAYIRLRDENPDYIRALMEPDVMTIPANIKEGKVIRPDRTGPVFSVQGNNNLHMRYTARAHNVIWKDNVITQTAVKALDKLLKSNDSAIFRATLQSGWGLISNNVLHDRSGFEDDPDATRLLYRLRFYDALKKV